MVEIEDFHRLLPLTGISGRRRLGPRRGGTLSASAGRENRVVIGGAALPFAAAHGYRPRQSQRGTGENSMAIAKVNGVDIHYEILGEMGPFVALQPGGRRARAGVRSLAEKIAEAGYRVLVYDRR